MSDSYQRVNDALKAAHEGIEDIRAERERAAKEQEMRTASLVSTEGVLRALAIRSARARRSRHLQSNESFGPRAPARDGECEVTPLDERTRRSLEVMGLSRK